MRWHVSHLHTPKASLEFQKKQREPASTWKEKTDSPKLNPDLRRHAFTHVMYSCACVCSHVGVHVCVNILTQTYKTAQNSKGYAEKPHLEKTKQNNAKHTQYYKIF